MPTITKPAALMPVEKMIDYFILAAQIPNVESLKDGLRKHLNVPLQWFPHEMQFDPHYATAFTAPAYPRSAPVESIVAFVRAPLRVRAFRFADAEKGTGTAVRGIWFGNVQVLHDVCARIKTADFDAAKHVRMDACAEPLPPLLTITVTVEFLRNVAFSFVIVGEEQRNPEDSPASLLERARAAYLLDMIDQAPRTDLEYWRSLREYIARIHT